MCVRLALVKETRRRGWAHTHRRLVAAARMRRLMSCGCKSASPCAKMATAPATCGTLMEVPDHTEKVWSPALDAPPTLSPGAKISTQRPVLLLGHTESSSELAATVSVASTLAGDSAHESPSLLPVRGSEPREGVWM